MELILEIDGLEQVASKGGGGFDLLEDVGLVDLVVGIVNGVIIWVPIASGIFYLNNSSNSLRPEGTFIPSSTASA